MNVKWEQNVLMNNGSVYGRVILRGHRWRIERFLDSGVLLNLGWRETAEDAMRVLELATTSS